ncbi:DNA topoisomerase IV subunit A [Magnetospira sp. QH-2]|uniref:DNA topoisomerase IV subunit A n=1 Tax=Magnetospira sp. (strain QH-2) TaxID=1288970 RepID=UPI0003E8102D|nr:DNA topoisomerase IV subunit A [Magnetospira sp. QH-2]CCQ73709.1 DNA topoisomerase IV, subunit A [Magnetospira sp. QH-2]
MAAEVAPAEDIRETRLADALGERYLSYALSTIMSRSLPDVRDGLKPVHRRLLFAMRQLKLDPKTGFKKCARIVGDVMGKYHPHGDQAIYDAMVRLAQEFAQRYPLVDGQGNFGNIDGDNAAAMRYTEARLTEVATALLDGIDEDTVDFRSTYDGEEDEPVVLPAAFPNLLANGAQGIAVGMATNVPPHNAGELCDALIHLIKHSNATIDKLVDMVRGPDFPTGGILVDARETIVEAYRTGRGAFRLRARWEVEKLRLGMYQIVVTEIPYQVQKSRLIEKIADLMNQRKLPFLADVRDESTEEVRLILEPRNRTLDPNAMMEQMFRLTELEGRVGFNMNLLDAENTPRVMTLREALQAFLDHRHVVLVRRSEFRLGKIAHRLHILEGYLIAFLNLDEVIRIIREEDEPKQDLMRAFDLTDIQAEAILNMRLRQLRKLEEMELRREHDALSAEKTDLEDLLADDGRRWKRIAEEIAETRKKFGQKTELGRRRTEIGEPPSAEVVPLDVMIEREPITVLCSEKGWIRAMKGHVADVSEVKYKEGDREGFVLRCETTDKLLVFGTNGRFYTLGGDRLPGGRGMGEPVRLMVDLPNDHDIAALVIHKPGRKLVLASSDGRGFQVEENDVLAQTRSGKQILNVAKGATAKFCLAASGDSVATVGKNRKLLVFPLEELPVMTRGRGVILQKYKDGGLSDIKTFTLEDGLTWSLGERTRTETDLTAWRGKRAQAGRLPPNGFPKSNRFT